MKKATRALSLGIICTVALGALRRHRDLMQGLE